MTYYKKTMTRKETITRQGQLQDRTNYREKQLKAKKSLSLRGAFKKAEAHESSGFEGFNGLLAAAY